ncbi:MAG: exodeoxyribonuclease VII small subunit [Kiloniellaceae bacterium]
MAKEDSDRDVQKMSFEDALEELKQIVARLESGEGMLEEAIEAYERGAALKRHCEAKLREAQEKIEKISLGPEGAVKAESFDTN